MAPKRPMVYWLRGMPRKKAVAVDTDRPPIPDNKTEERRAIPRAPTLREALFSPWSERGGFARGVAVDISPNGMQIHTGQPEAAGEPIDIELQPKAGSASGRVIRVRGRVVWTQPSGGQWLMGVQFSMHLPAGADAAVSVANAEQARELITQISQQIRSLDGLQASPLAYAEYQQSEQVPAVAFRAAPEEGRRTRRRLAALLLLLLLGLLLFWLPGRKVQHVEEGSPHVFESGAGTAGDRDGVPPEVLKPERAFEPLSDETAPPVLAAAPFPLLSQAQQGLAEGHADRAMEAFRALQDLEDPSLTERFIGRLGQAQALHALGERGAAVAMLTAALAAADSVPEPWRTAGEQVRQRLAAGVPASTVPGLLSEGFELGDARELPAAARALATPIAPPQESTPGTPTPEPAGAPRLQQSPTKTLPPPGPRIEVSTTDYLLTVFENGEPLGVFPVGLGRDASTPQGDFTVANKLTNPDWYNRGKVVKAGDPANPLGKRWMGLGDATGPTSYGIHPTRDLDSIGKNASRGCVRMRPEDAEQVFAWCPVGTPVHIGP